MPSFPDRYGDQKQEKIRSLRRTIRHMANRIADARTEIKLQHIPLADLHLQEALNDKRFEYH